MLHRYINQFVEYCQLANFSVRSIQALAIRLNEFEIFLKSLRILSVKKITYLRLVDFVADYKDPSIHVRKFRVWTLRQFYHFLTLHRIVAENIATGIPYPKIGGIQRDAHDFMSRGTPMILCVSYPVDVCYVIIYTKKNRVNQNIKMLLMSPFFCQLFRLLFSPTQNLDTDCP